MRTYVALLAAALLALSACSDGDTGSNESDQTTESMEVAELEELVADSVTPDDQDAEVSAECEDGIDVEVDARQDCEVMVGEDTAYVHFVVTEVDGGEVTDAEFTPFVPGVRLAQVVQQQFAAQGTVLDDVQCDELDGEFGEKATCTSTSGSQEPNIEVDVTKVDGLFINFHMSVVE
jgi:hypothetical protein